MADAISRSRPILKRVVAPKPYDLLADQLREAILRGQFAVGETLPPERQLVEQTGLTRGSIREALRTLATEGLLQTRPGRFGGNVVTLPGQESMANAIGHFVRGRHLPLRVLNDTRGVIEPALARLAALYRTNADLQEIQSLHQQLVEAADQFHDFSLINMQWHNAVAKASHNALLAGMLNAISYGVVVSTTVEEYDTPETRNQVIWIHGQITEAIAAQDGEMAEKRMQQHLGATRARVTVPDSTDIPLSGI